MAGMRVLALLLLTAAPALAQDLPPGMVSAELLPGWVAADGARMTALHIELEPGWKTYWRSPGDAGIPPIFDWQGSTNMAGAELLWPRPEIIESGGERTLGYHDSLVLPIRVAPAHPGEPVTIRAMVDLGVCLDICVPVQLTLEAGPPGPAPDPRIEAALAQMPAPSDLQPECSITRIEDGMQVSLSLPDTGRPSGDEIAVELRTPDVWVSEPWLDDADGRIKADFVDASGQPFALDPDDLRVTLIGAEDAVELSGCRDGKALPRG